MKQPSPPLVAGHESLVREIARESAQRALDSVALLEASEATAVTLVALAEVSHNAYLRACDQLGEATAQQLLAYGMWNVEGQRQFD